MLKNIHFLLFFLILIPLQIVNSQSSSNEYIEVKGTVNDFNDLPIKGAWLYVDSVRTKEKTNNKGSFKAKLNPNTKLVTIYSPDYGFISQVYNGAWELTFKFSQNAKPFAKEDLESLGFKVDKQANMNTSNYSDFKSIYEILKAKFPQVRIIGTKIVIAKGVNSYSGNTDPLILVNRRPTNDISTIPTSEIKSIRVIKKGSETAEYGIQGLNGVLLITLKN